MYVYILPLNKGILLAKAPKTALHSTAHMYSEQADDDYLLMRVQQRREIRISRLGARRPNPRPQWMLPCIWNIS